MKLSIIIPVFNEEKTIEKVLLRVIGLEIQKVLEEIIVVDDGLNDKTVEKIKYDKRWFNCLVDALEV